MPGSDSNNSNSCSSNLSVLNVATNGVVAGFVVPGVMFPFNWLLHVKQAGVSNSIGLSSVMLFSVMRTEYLRSVLSSFPASATKAGLNDVRSVSGDDAAMIFYIAAFDTLITSYSSNMRAIENHNSLLKALNYKPEDLLASPKTCRQKFSVASAAITWRLGRNALNFAGLWGTELLQKQFPEAPSVVAPIFAASLTTLPTIFSNNAITYSIENQKVTADGKFVYPGSWQTLRAVAKGRVPIFCMSQFALHGAYAVALNWSVSEAAWISKQVEPAVSNFANSACTLFRQRPVFNNANSSVAPLCPFSSL